MYLIRHGETTYNAEGRIQGQLAEPPLNETGRQQAQACCSTLPQPITRIFSSPLVRAMETARIISERIQVPIEKRDWLAEINVGALAGKTWQDIGADAGDGVKAMHEALEYDYTPYGGETAEDTRRRIRSFWREIVQYKTESGKILVVTHSGIIRHMYLMADRGDPRPVIHARPYELEL